VVDGGACRRGPGRAARGRLWCPPQPLDEGPRPSGLSDEAWRAQVAARRTSPLAALGEPTLGRALTPTERTALDAALSDILRRSGVPVLPLVVDALLGPPAAFAETTVEQLRTDGRDVGHALARLVRGDLASPLHATTPFGFGPEVGCGRTTWLPTARPLQVRS
jgi:hypothetical protein